jgi:hypothetical protein
VGYTYLSFQQALALYMAIPQSNIATPNFVAALPSIIDYAEQRCYRELDLLAARGNWFGPMTPSAPGFQISTGVTYPLTTNLPLPITIERARILPAGISLPPVWTSVASAQPCMPVSPEFLDAVFGPGSTPGTPVFFSHTAQDFLDFGPIPDQAYMLALFGEYRPFPLYSAQPNDGSQVTFLTTYVPDLFLAAAMINAAGYQKNFGAQADDPKMAQSWETQFQSLSQSVQKEEMRKRFHGWQAGTAESSPPPTPQPVPGG